MNPLMWLCATASGLQCNKPTSEYTHSKIQTPLHVGIPVCLWHVLIEMMAVFVLLLQSSLAAQ